MVTKLRNSFITALLLGATFFLSGCKLAILDPKGVIAADEKHILITAVLLMLIVVIPVILLTIGFAWRYRASNTKAKYSPDWAHSTALEVVWWSIPCVIIGILATITWISSHELDPYKPLDANVKPITIQAIALNWKWLFIYPDQNIATVNYVQLPVNVPIKFVITSDAPMNSFQVPQLAGQIYAMAGMQTRLNLMANEVGDYRGLSTNYSGEGFSNMKFVVRSSSLENFDKWVQSIQRVPQKLTTESYNRLAQPSINNTTEYFSSARKDLFNMVVMKSMMPMQNTNYASNTVNQTNLAKK